MWNQLIVGNRPKERRAAPLVATAHMSRDGCIGTLAVISVVVCTTGFIEKIDFDFD